MLIMTKSFSSKIPSCAATLNGITNELMLFIIMFELHYNKYYMKLILKKFKHNNTFQQF